MMRKYFLKRVQKFFLYMMLPTLLVFSLSLFLLVRTSHEKMVNEGRQTVEAIRAGLEPVINNALNQNALFSTTTRMSLAIRNLLTGKQLSYSDSVFISSMRSMLHSIIITHDYISAIYLYLDNGTHFYSTDGGILSTANSSDSTWLQYYQEMPENQQNLVIARSSNRYVAEENTITIYQRLLLQKGCIVVNININRFKDMLRTMNPDKNETVYILNGEKEILVWQNQDNKSLELPADFFSRMTAGQNETVREAFETSGNFITWVNSRRCLVNVEHYTDQNLYVVSMIDATSGNDLIGEMLWVYALIFICNCIVILVISYWTTKRIFDQIQYMIDVFDDAEKGIFHAQEDRHPLNDEYSLVMNNVMHTFLNSSYLNMQLKEREALLESAELKALQLQINPHFLFNTLQSVELQARKILGRENDMSRILQNVSDILKYSLQSAKRTVTVETEIRYLKKYVEIQRFRFGETFIVYYEVDEKALQGQVFKLMLQPLVENSILHGVRNLERTGYIKVKILRRGEELVCSVTDNGRGFSRERINELYERIHDEQSESIGLTNVNRRLKLTYGESSELKIRSKAGMGTDILFRIPWCE
ncbi:histidine kinase [Acetatifactor muris]|jgi:two-component system sensor histidine kinase YesM|uniref:Putative sensor-like histidine kinase n=1 Tax=Acetatifactor muris TaxID=879566 RepID=A0A2K4ZL19_9FIRM|nr:histidine kinase [Acetatifactor muris]MCR2049432.1 histidine kinase [Acetatifactor muris]SOY31140.1 putative sensor-like histidine kinase [Acetatifactor muris]